MKHNDDIKHIREYKNVFTFMGKKYGYHKNHLYRMQYINGKRLYTARKLTLTKANNKLGYVIGQRFKSLEQIKENWPINNLKKKNNGKR
jgi:hypothetical protein